MRLSLLSLASCLALSFALLSGLHSPAPLPVAVAKAQEKEKADEKAVAGDDKLVKDVKKAIDEGIGYLLAQQGKEGSWEAGMPQQGSGGATSLVLLALINSGLKPNHPAVQRGLEWLRKNPTDKTYAAGLQTMVYCLVNDKVDRKRISDHVTALLNTRLPDGWSYGPLGVRKAGLADNSNTQYALLGIHEANQRSATGLAVERKVLLEIRDHFLKTQSKAGGWGYHSRNQAGNMNMTTAGL